MKYPKYNVNIYVHGHREYTTPCPFGITGHYTHEVLMAGSLACQRCEYFKGIDKKDSVVACGIM